MSDELKAAEWDEQQALQELQARTQARADAEGDLQKAKDEERDAEHVYNEANRIAGRLRRKAAMEKFVKDGGETCPRCDAPAAQMRFCPICMRMAGGNIMRGAAKPSK